MSIRAVELSVDIYERLNVILSRREIAQTVERITWSIFVNDRCPLAWQLLDIYSEERASHITSASLKPRFSAVIAAYYYEGASRNWLGVHRLWKSDLKTRSGLRYSKTGVGNDKGN
jgi:hypothetical protein